MKLNSGALDGSLVTDLAEAMAKAKALESFLHLATRDCSFDDFLNEVLRRMMEALPSEAGSIFEMNHQEKNLRIRSASGQSTETLSSVIVPVGQGVVGHVAESMMPVLVSNAPENRMHIKVISNLTGLQVKNLMAVPLVVRGRVYGVAEILNKVSGTGFDEADLALFSYLALMAARVIEVRMMLNWVKQREQAA